MKDLSRRPDTGPGGDGIANATSVQVRCRNCGSTNLTPITPYWSRCANCREVTYTSGGSAATPDAGLAEGAVHRPVYGVETVPLPLKRDPRRRLIGVALGFVAPSLYVASAPLAIALLASEHGLTYDQVLLLAGVSLIATLWIFQCIGFAAVGFYAPILVLQKKAYIGAGWVVLGTFEIVFSAVFVSIGALTGAWLGLAAGILMVVAGVLNVL
jgi:hypothetical protein